MKMTDLYTTCFGDGTCSILIVPDYAERIEEALIANLSQNWETKYKLFFVDKSKIVQDGDETEVYNNLAEKCCQIVRENKISAVFANRKMSNLIKSYIVKQIPTLCGPSSISVAVSMHKYYTSQLIDSSDTRFPELLVNLGNDLYEIGSNVLCNFGIPCYGRTGFSNDNLSCCCKNKEELMASLHVLRNESDIKLRHRRKFIESLPELEEYPQLLKPVALFQKDISRFSTAMQNSAYENVFIEAAVFKGQIIPWAICDLITLPHGSQEPTKYFLGYEMPTKLSQSKEDLLWKRFRGDIENLKSKGFDNSFVYAEYFVFDDVIELFNINGFPHTNCTSMYSKALKGGNNIEASFQLSIGQKPTTPTLTGSFVMTHNMVVVNSGKADKLINFDAAKAFKDLVLRYKAGETIMIPDEKACVMIGVITATGDTFDDCVKQVGAIRNAVIKIPELVPVAST